MASVSWVDLLAGLMVALAIIFIFASSQVFWLTRVSRLIDLWISKESLRRTLKGAGLAAYFLLLIYNLTWPQLGLSPTRLTLGAILFRASFRWWFFGSFFGFLLIILFSAADRAVRALAWVNRRAHRAQPSGTPAPLLGRRRFIEKTATLVGALPFAGGAYGLLYGRTDFEITHRGIGLRALPKAFDGIRIAQLSDFHIGPFMTASEISHVVEMTLREKPDLIFLTGDYVTWDGTTQYAVVDVLAALRAPLGVFGCLGNHEIYTRTEASITRLFAARGIRILRQERTDIRVNGERINLIGVDFQAWSPLGHFAEGYVSSYLQGVDSLMQRDTANILLSHNPNTFDRAAELGIDLSLAGHTHGGQVALEFLSPQISPALLFTRYVVGKFEKPGAQLYVNRGIGTIGVPIRIGVPPEITIFELTRA